MGRIRIVDSHGEGVGVFFDTVQEWFKHVNKKMDKKGQEVQKY